MTSVRKLQRQAERERRRKQERRQRIMFALGAVGMMAGGIGLVIALAIVAGMIGR